MWCQGDYVRLFYIVNVSVSPLNCLAPPFAQHTRQNTKIKTFSKMFPRLLGFKYYHFHFSAAHLYFSATFTTCVNYYYFFLTCFKCCRQH